MSLAIAIYGCSLLILAPGRDPKCAKSSLARRFFSASWPSRFLVNRPRTMLVRASVRKPFPKMPIQFEEDQFFRSIRAFSERDLKAVAQALADEM